MARLLAVEEGTVRKYAEAPDASGRDMPQEKALTLLRHASQDGNPAAQNLIDEYLTHFGHAAERRIVRLSALREIEQALLDLKNGTAHDSILERCPECGRVLKVVGKTGGFFIYHCEHGCGRGGEAAA